MLVHVLTLLKIQKKYKIAGYIGKKKRLEKENLDTRSLGQIKI